MKLTLQDALIVVAGGVYGQIDEELYVSAKKVLNFHVEDLQIKLERERLEDRERALKNKQKGL